MGRAIVRQPSAFLLDEPLSNLDAKLRVQMRAEISGLQRTLGVTTCYVTHDQVEAMTMGDRVAMIKDGVLQQVDAPQDLYDRPDNMFVAAFIGSPSMNLFEGAFSLCEGGATLQVGSQDLLVPHETLGARPALRGYDGRTLIFGIRPEDLADAEVEPLPEEQCLVSEVALVEALGADVLVHLVTEATPVDAGDPDAVDDLAATGVVVARFTPRSRVQMARPSRWRSTPPASTSSTPTPASPSGTDRPVSRPPAQCGCQPQATPSSTGCRGGYAPEPPTEAKSLIFPNRSSNRNRRSAAW